MFEEDEEVKGSAGIKLLGESDKNEDGVECIILLTSCI